MLALSLSSGKIVYSVQTLEFALKTLLLLHFVCAVNDECTNGKVLFQIHCMSFKLGLTLKCNRSIGLLAFSLSAESKVYTVQNA